LLVQYSACSKLVSSSISAPGVVVGRAVVVGAAVVVARGVVVGAAVVVGRGVVVGAAVVVGRGVVVTAEQTCWCYRR